jgi:hypothetical protein
VSGGFLTDVYEGAMGTKIEPKHALLYQSGNVAGIGTSFILGMRAPTWATTKIGPLKWTASALTGLDLYGAGKASYTATGNFIARGNRFEWSDTWNLLSLVPFAGLLLGGTSKAKNFFAANRAAQSPDSAVQTIGTTATKTGNCFVAGTEILTSEGEKKIEDIQVGDWVVADDPNTPGEIEYKQVLDAFARHTDKLVDLYVDGQIISTTGEHPFWTPDRGWVEAKDLVVGSLVQTADGRIIDVDKVDQRKGDFTVYNFKVEGFHTYFVSDLGILVHNANCNLGNIPIHPKRTRFYVKASELTNADNLKPMHPVNSDQLLGTEIVGHGGVQNLSNDDLIKFGGSQGDDPIRGFRDFAIGDDLVFPGSEIHIRGGHHRIYEIGNRVADGRISPDTLIEFLIDN